MVLYPGCQAHAQHEIESVIGNDRLPDFADRQRLPYLECLVQETLRGITLDESVYKDPTAFDPARFLPAPVGRGKPYPTAQYGFGRR
ncbi:hypothetical protein H0H87_008755 [Tephrocybe sp. NHM501043]|nr:hypothetical protein H0H87_008755 [Tephrocybe sp. NHM501043]